MKEIILKFPSGYVVIVRETDEPEPNSYAENIIHVTNIYQWAYKTFDFQTATDACVAISKWFINKKIDKIADDATTSTK